MPPRFAYWTILIDNAPTAFRAQTSEELLPTVVQLRRTNRDVVMKWFARGRLWESPEASRAAAQAPKLNRSRNLVRSRPRTTVRSRVKSERPRGKSRK